MQDLQDSDRYAQRFSVSYITGSHTFKTGFQLGQGVKNLHQYSWSDYHYTFLRGVPTQITQLATPYTRKERIRGRPRDLRAGSMGVPPPDGELRAALRLLQRLRPRAAHAGDQVRAGAGFRAGVRRAELEGHQPAARRGVRPVGQRQDGGEGVARPLCREDRHCHRRRQQPGDPVGSERVADLGRREWQLRAGLQPGQPDDQRRMRGDQQRQLRPGQRECHPVRRRGDSRVGRPRLPVGRVHRAAASVRRRACR